jgi:hypothetical protein
MILKLLQFFLGSRDLFWIKKDSILEMPKKNTPFMVVKEAILCERKDVLI